VPVPHPQLSANPALGMLFFTPPFNRNNTQRRKIKREERGSFSACVGGARKARVLIPTSIKKPSFFPCSSSHCSFELSRGRTAVGAINTGEMCPQMNNIKCSCFLPLSRSFSYSCFLTRTIL
jgi:hypothetical protein